MTLAGLRQPILRQTEIFFRKPFVFPPAPVRFSIAFPVQSLERRCVKRKDRARREGTYFVPPLQRRGRTVHLSPVDGGTSSARWCSLLCLDLAMDVLFLGDLGDLYGPLIAGAGLTGSTRRR